jgi:glyoxylase-like metal-dependent hydrolase (beta-lactamase superfamily II)
MQVGQMAVVGISDGSFVARPSYFGEPASSTARSEFFDRGGAAWLPIGCFLIRTPDSLILVDAGLGPESKSLPNDMLLVGGQLLTGLYAVGVGPSDIDAIVCTHLHSDHVGWLFTPDAKPVFASATIWVSATDLDAVLNRELESADHIRRGLETFRDTTIVRRMSESVEITPGVVAHPSPGHTLGHYLVELTSNDQQLLLVGDAITCPIQLYEPRWHSYGDQDADLGNATRNRIWEKLQEQSVYAVGSHFPGLRPGSVSRVDRRWVEDGINAQL